MKNIFIFSLFLASFNTAQAAGPTVVPQIAQPTVAQEIILDFEEIAVPCALGNEGTIDAMSIDTVNKEVKVSVVVGYDPGFVCPIHDITAESSIGYLTVPGDYHFSIYFNNGSIVDPIARFSEPDFVDSSFNLTVSPANSIAAAETPAEGSIQSGVGLIRGWACDAVKIEVSIDDGGLIPVAYGTSREDTRAICGDANNGYGMVMPWGVLGEGTHTLKTVKDGVEIGNVTFEVASIGGTGFMEGLSGTYELDNFPTAGESVTVRWSQPDQNFIIIDKK